MATTANLVFDLGETWIIDLTAYDSDGLTAFDLTGATVALYVKGSSAAILTPANTTVVLTTPASGKARITVTPAQQAAAGITAAQVGNYVLRVTLNTGVVTDQAVGSFTIRATAAS